MNDDVLLYRWCIWWYIWLSLNCFCIFLIWIIVFIFVCIVLGWIIKDVLYIWSFLSSVEYLFIIFFMMLFWLIFKLSGVMFVFKIIIFLVFLLFIEKWMFNVILEDWFIKWCVK